MAWLARLAVVAVVLLLGLSVGDVIPPPLAPLMIVALGLVLWRNYSGFLMAVVTGLVGGALAGLLILGPGFRLAMRAVAIMDPVRPEEFTLGGTLFIVVGVGVLLGGIHAVMANLLRKAFSIGSAVGGGSLLAALVMVNLTFFSGEVSDELFSLGISPWINIPLFSMIALAYGIGTMAVADLAEDAMFRRRRIEVEKVPA
jgi:hypothetical protein